MQHYQPINDTFALDNQEKSELIQLIDKMPPIDFENQHFDQALLSEICYYSRRIPSRLLHFTMTFKNLSNEEGAILIKNLPIDENLPPTPNQQSTLKKHTYYSEWLLLLLNSNIGDIVAYNR